MSFAQSAYLPGIDSPWDVTAMHHVDRRYRHENTRYCHTSGHPEDKSLWRVGYTSEAWRVEGLLVADPFTTTPERFFLVLLWNRRSNEAGRGPPDKRLIIAHPALLPHLVEDS